MRTLLISAVLAVAVASGLWMFWSGSGAPGDRSMESESAAASVPDGKYGKWSPEAGEAWEVLLLGGRRVGSSHLTWGPAAESDEELVKTSLDMQLDVRRFGQPLRMRTRLETVETADGDLKSFRYEFHNPPAAPSRTSGRVEGERMVLESETGGQTVRSTRAWRAGTKSPAWPERSFWLQPPRPGERREFSVYVPEANAITPVEIQVGDRQEQALFDGRREKLFRAEVSRKVDRMQAEFWLTPAGRQVKMILPFAGQELVAHRVSEEDAAEGSGDAKLDLNLATVAKVGRIPNAHAADRITYRVTLPGGDPSAALPDEPYQRVRRLSEHVAELTVRRVDGSTGSSPSASSPAKSDQDEYARATRFLQCDDDEVQRHAEAGAAGETDPLRVAHRLERYVRDLVTDKNFSTALASAAEVARSREGDCTEHAVLLAALLRCRGIPSRVAAGLVYVEALEGFGWHMWTEALIGGHWIPLDATLGLGGAGPAHIKLADSSLADDAPAPVTAFVPLLKLLGTVRIEVIRVE